MGVLMQLGLSPVQAKLCVAIVQGVALPAHHIHDVVGAVLLMEDAVQDAVIVTACKRFSRTVGKPGVKSM